MWDVGSKNKKYFPDIEVSGQSHINRFYFYLFAPYCFFMLTYAHGKQWVVCSEELWTTPQQKGREDWWGCEGYTREGPVDSGYYTGRLGSCNLSLVHQKQ